MKLTDAELERLVAEKVMGWEPYGNPLHGWRDRKEPEAGHPVMSWHPLTNWSHAGEVVERMRTTKKAAFSIENADLEPGSIEAVFWCEANRNCPLSWTDKSGPRAITIAALLAVGAVTEDQV